MQNFIKFAVESNVLKFGSFVTKAGRDTPYFFNAGLFNDGTKLMRLGEFYAAKIKESGIEFDVLYGAAYKGIPLVSAVSIALARLGVNKEITYNRKEIKGHGEGGILVGAEIKDKNVLIVDDVISSGLAVRDKMASEEISDFGIKVLSLATLDDLVKATKTPELDQYRDAIENYKARYGSGGEF